MGIFLENFKLLIKPFEKVINTITLAGGRFIFVGGCVRDVFLNLPPKDIDAEVYGIPLPRLKQALELVDIVSEVGKQFGVLKLKNYPIDISLPRFDIKTGPGHKGFSIKVDYSISFKQAAKRRDLTMNAIGFDPIRNEVLDPYQGVMDIHKRILKAVDPQTFVEDPLRGLRVAQFASRFLMDPHKTLVFLCQKLNLTELPRERIFDEIKKILLLGQKPSKGFIFLKEANLLHQFFPALNHLESRLWEKTLSILDQATLVRSESQDQALVFMLSILCFYLDDKETRVYLNSCIIREKQKNQVLVLLEKGRSLFQEKKVEQRSNLFWIGKALIDQGLCWHNLFLFLKMMTQKASWVQELSQKVLSTGASLPKNLEPIVTGNHLIKKGLKPGKKFNELLNKCLTIQYEQGLTSADKILEEIL